MLTRAEVEATGRWIARQQAPSGEIPWARGDKTDPWDHVHAAMGLATAGRVSEARRAFLFLSGTQLAEGGWPVERRDGATVDRAIDTNHTAYVATGLWHHHLVTGDTEFLERLWPMVERAIGLVVALQHRAGWVPWAIAATGKVWEAPLLTGSSSIHGSLVAAERIAETLGHDRPRWRDARERIAAAIRDDLEAFADPTLVARPGRFSMDWYYPVLGGALRGPEARDRLSAESFWARFVTEGVGCRCVDDAPWYTTAETCELVLALDAAGLTHRARDVLTWLAPHRSEDGAWETGRTHPEGVVWPRERNAWTAASALLADDALTHRTGASGLFRSLGDAASTATAAATAS